MKLAILLSLVSQLLSSPQCGTHLQKDNSSRFARHIIGGNAVTSKRKWPWQMFLVSAAENGHKKACGGTVISENWVLTAAHCVRLLVENTTDVVDMKQVALVGVLAKIDDQAVDYIIKSEKLIYHSNYTPLEYGHDIALIKLEIPLIFDDTISPICLPNKDQSILSDGYAVATGYGAANYRGTDKLIDEIQLRETILPIIRSDICKARWDDLFVADDHICAGAMGHGAYHGDSGGPLMMKDNDNRWFQIGIAAFAGERIFTEADLKPNGFTDVRMYCDWIEEKTGGEVKCQGKEVTLKDVEIQY